jgi:cytoskeletal protein RodZ
MNDLKSANSVKIGKQFTDIRNKKNFTVDQVAKSLVMSTNYVKAIESGTYSIFPSEAFARAYFLKYKNFLSINCEFPSLYNEKEKRKISKRNTKLKFNYFLTKYRRYSTAMLIIISLLIVVFKIINLNINSEVKAAPVLIKDNVEELSIIQDNFKKEVDQKIFLPLENSYLDYQKTSTEKHMNNSLRLNFVENCWVEISSNNKLIVYQLFKSGETYSAEIEKPFKIIVGNVRGIEGTYNSNNIDFISNANRLRVNTILFNDE